MPYKNPTEGKVLGMMLRRARELYAIGLREFARDVGLSAAYVSRIETGHMKPSDKVLRMYADKFRADFDELSRLAGRVPEDLREHLVKNPASIKKLRETIRKGGTHGKGTKD